MITNDLSISRLAFAQSHTAADGLLLTAQTELKLDNAEGTNNDPKGKNAEEQSTFDTLESNARTARAANATPRSNSAASNDNHSQGASGNNKRSTVGQLVDKTA